MKVLEIGGKNYTVEYSIEASLYSDCTVKLMDLMGAMETKDPKEAIKKMANIPQVVITMLHAGLLEHHSDELETENDTKVLVKKYIVEHKEDGKGNFYSIMEDLMECMGDDGFFKIIGLEAMSEKAVNGAKKPQTKKAVKVTAK